MKYSPYQPKTGSQFNECATFFFSSPFFIFYYFSFSFSIFYFEWIPTWLSRSIVFLNPVEVQKFTWIYRHDIHEIILEISFWIETDNAIAAKFAIFFSFFNNLNSVIGKWFNTYYLFLTLYQRFCRGSYWVLTFKVS